jgi:death on curing protein
MSDIVDDWPPRPTNTRVLELHAAALKHSGGMPGLREPGLLDGAVAGAITATLYTSPNDTMDPLWMAAHLLCYIARDHPFVDGNKRVAWLSCEEQLRLVRLRVTAAVDDAERLVLDVVARRLEARDIVAWLAARLSPYDP